MTGGGGGSGNWRKSSFSNNGGCVQVRFTPDTEVHVRDSKLGADSAVLTFTRLEWAAFLDGVRAGEFDTDSPHGDPHEWLTADDRGGGRGD